MVKRLRENRKNKKGFTLVELIVVIVIILVLAAVMVPSVLRYVDKANRANTKSDAATVLVDIQAQIADAATKKEAITTLSSNGITVSVLGSKDAATKVVYKDAPIANCQLSDENDVIYFSYADSKYDAEWTPDDGWSGTWEE